MAVNNITWSASPPPLTSIALGSGTSGGVNSSIRQDGPCLAHHVPGGAYYSTLNNTSNTVNISHEDINSFKYAFKTLVDDFKRGRSGKGFVNSRAATFADKQLGNIIEFTEWGQVQQIIKAFYTSTTNINRGDTIYAAFYNELINTYNSYKNNCLCNSDCGCNQNCVCNTDCGCNYSDKRLKENVKYYYSMFYNDIEVPFYTFNYIQNKETEELDLPKSEQVGVIAQELIKLGLSEFVETNDLYFQVNYDELNKVLIREQRKQNENI